MQEQERAQLLRMICGCGETFFDPSSRLVFRAIRLCAMSANVPASSEEHLEPEISADEAVRAKDLVTWRVPRRNHPAAPLPSCLPRSKTSSSTSQPLPLSV